MVFCVVVPFFRSLIELNTLADSCVVLETVEVLLYSPVLSPFDVEADGDVRELTTEEVVETCESEDDGPPDVGVSPKPFKMYNPIPAPLVDELSVEARDVACFTESDSEDDARELVDEEDRES